jgi:hypothetical protein
MILVGDDGGETAMPDAGERGESHAYWRATWRSATHCLSLMDVARIATLPNNSDGVALAWHVFS